MRGCSRSMTSVSNNPHPTGLFAILLTSLMLIASCSSRAGLPELAPAAGEQPLYPNIVIIMADDLGWNDVGFNGSEIRTPNLDRLAAEGVVLNRFYAQPTCSPTRAALMTGQSPLRLGVLAPMSKNMQNGLPLSERILPQYLQDAGYHTALLGKWHLGGNRRPYHPNNRGFDYVYGNLHGGIGYWDHVHGGGYDLQRNGKTVREEGYVTDLIAEEAVRVIAERDIARPLFLMASFNAPHLPNEAPEAAISSYSDIPDPRRRVHAAMVSQFDAAVGEIVTALEAEGLIDNTIIWFLSDNGGLIPAPAARQPVPRAGRRTARATIWYSHDTAFPRIHSGQLDRGRIGQFALPGLQGLGLRRRGPGAFTCLLARRVGGRPERGVRERAGFTADPD